MRWFSYFYRRFKLKIKVKVHTDLQNIQFKNPVITIGIFDGVHTGHREIINEVKNIANEEGTESVLITFWPHPKMVLNNSGIDLKFLTTLEEKEVLLRKCNIDHLVVLPFNLELSQQSACEFIQKTLVNRLHVKNLIVGFNHQFGKDRKGNYETIKACAEKFNFNTLQLLPKLIDGEKVSSTLIREALWSGQIKRANRLLGYEYFVNGTIVGGKRIGRQIGFPTANIIPKESHKLIPMDGVYAIRLMISNVSYNGMLNIGIRPTLNSERVSKTIEVNIFDFSQDIYGQNVTLIFIDRIRDEIRFENIESLVNQLKKDQKSALAILKSEK